MSQDSALPREIMLDIARRANSDDQILRAINKLHDTRDMSDEELENQSAVISTFVYRYLIKAGVHQKHTIAGIRAVDWVSNFQVSDCEDFEEFIGNSANTSPFVAKGAGSD